MLEVRATGVCRSDWHGWKGHDGDVIAHGLPFTPGHEVSGVVVERGAGVELEIGARCRCAIHPLVRMLPRVRPRAAPRYASGSSSRDLRSREASHSTSLCPAPTGTCACCRTTSR